MYGVKTRRAEVFATGLAAVVLFSLAAVLTGDHDLESSFSSYVPASRVRIPENGIMDAAITKLFVFLTLVISSQRRLIHKSVTADRRKIREN
jgi:hypothetical protein